MPYMQGMARAQGDPGFFSFLGKAIGTVARAIPGPVGAIAQAVGLPTFGGAPAIPLPAPILMQQAPTTTVGGIRLPGGIQIGGGTVTTAPPVGAAGPCPPGMECAVGFHKNKSSYFLRSGEFVPKGSRCVRNRSRNPANAKALRKAIGRATAFDKLVKRNRKSLRALARI